MRLQLFAILKRNTLRRLEIHILIGYGECASLVDNESIHLAQLLNSGSVLHKYAFLSRLAYANHEGSRSSQAHGTRTGYHKHRYCREQSLGQHGVASNHKPHDKREQRNAQHTWHKHERHLVDNTLHGCLGALSLLNRAYDIGKHRLAPYLLGTETQNTLAHNCASKQTAALMLGHRHWLTRNHRLVDITLTLAYSAVDWHLLASAHLDNVAHAHRCYGYIVHAIKTYNMGLLGHKPH